MTEFERSPLDKMRKARGFWQRLRGLMFFKSYPYEGALLFDNCSAIHTFFMRFPIDVIFLNKEKVILKICHGLKPWRLCFCAGAYYVIETPAGSARQQLSRI
ncbi:MAG: DUF192 domain-containing protein [Candidatus Omnitrophica bacterium]|nr:DUF192 domain-containing protein [Candidatus Omnitrophota bacterium]